MRIEIAKQFSDAPGGRYIQDGKFSGEEFRKMWLEPALAKPGEHIVIVLDGAFGYPTSFLEEAFGGLTRLGVYTVQDLLGRLEFISDEDPSLIPLIKSYIEGKNA